MSIRPSSSTWRFLLANPPPLLPPWVQILDYCGILWGSRCPKRRLMLLTGGLRLLRWLFLRREKQSRRLLWRCQTSSISSSLRPIRRMLAMSTSTILCFCKQVPRAIPIAAENCQRSRRPRTESGIAKVRAGRQSTWHRTRSVGKSTWRRINQSAPWHPCSSTTPRAATWWATAETWPPP